MNNNNKPYTVCKGVTYRTSSSSDIISLNEVQLQVLGTTNYTANSKSYSNVVIKLEEDTTRDDYTYRELISKYIVPYLKITYRHYRIEQVQTIPTRSKRIGMFLVSIKKYNVDYILYDQMLDEREKTINDYKHQQLANKFVVDG